VGVTCGCDRGEAGDATGGDRGAGAARPMPRGGFSRNLVQGRRHAAVRVPTHGEHKARPLRMVASPRSDSDSDRDSDEESEVRGSMSDVLSGFRDMTPAEKRVYDAAPGAPGGVCSRMLTYAHVC
jgi:hypothetical protein